MDEIKDVIREKAIKLYTFLRDLTELRSKTAKSLDQYEKVLWFDEIPHETNCDCIAWHLNHDDEDRVEIWIEIKKPRLKEPPKTPDKLTPWLDIVDLSNSQLKFPELRKRITTEVFEGGTKSEPRLIFKNLEDTPDIKPMWTKYIEEQWKPWAEEDRKLKSIQEVYTQLFSIYNKIRGVTIKPALTLHGFLKTSAVEAGKQKQNVIV